ncbi:MAG TPA: 2-amino-4-hydroxy-6-hydroxymethyldihydropteridine diphosphokinase [Candidatus Alistipes excrementipullorum]|nr:2-amino-4-hydroxy-6-hydroxymethyldihydropteridine diphosphokinase [Candidatus Alistipes excrementipullorum]
MARVVLITGSNAPEAEKLLARARRLVAERVGAVEKESTVHRSRAWGFEAPDFSNQVLVSATSLAPEAVLDAVNAIETALGRDRQRELAEKAATGQRYASRPIDIDILFYDCEVIGTRRLTVPHPLMAERDFVLDPLAEVMRDFVHPTIGKSIEEIRNERRKS